MSLNLLVPLSEIVFVLCFFVLFDAKVSLVPLKLDGATWGPSRASFPDPRAPYIPEFVEAPGQAPTAVAPLLESLFKVKAVEHSREYIEAFFGKLLGVLPIPAKAERGPAKEKHEAIARIVAASKGQLNWALELPKASWKHVKEVTGSFEVRVGASGDSKCGFKFATKITLVDLVLVFGPTLIVLDVNDQMCSGTMSLLLKTSYASFEDFSSFVSTSGYGQNLSAPFFYGPVR
jgi:hypothetical protein